MIHARTKVVPFSVSSIILLTLASERVKLCKSSGEDGGRVLFCKAHFAHRRYKLH